MSGIFARVIVTAFSLVLVAQIIPGIEVTSALTAILAAMLIGVLNVLVRPILVLLMLPITLVTLGLFIFVINAFLFWIAASLIDGFTVSGFLPALAGSFIVSVVSTVINKKI
jgi:putative membrane protein